VHEFSPSKFLNSQCGLSRLSFNCVLEFPEMSSLSGKKMNEFVALAPVLPMASASAKQRSYAQILKSSAIVGGSTVLNIGIGIVRTKAIALILGPGGFGLAGLYTSIITLTQNIAGIGINSSGVRQIAEAAGNDDKQKIARTAVVLRRSAIVLGLLGALALLVFSKEVAILTFGNAEHRGAVCLLSLAVLFQLVSTAQGALIQGMRQIADLAKMNVIGALSGAIISIPVVYYLRERGVAISLVLVAAMTIVTSWWYSRKVRFQRPTLTTPQVREEIAGLLKLGIAFMASGLLVPGVAYLVRVILLQSAGMAATGMYQSAWTLGGLYINFILQAMGADFYPRLSATANNNCECNRLVNEQALIGILLAAPGVIATLTFAPLVIAIFYSAKFTPAVEVLRWICLGTMLQVITWPMGFIIVAKARQDLFLLSEFAWAVVATGLAWVCIRNFGLNGAGIAFFGSYIFHWILVYPIVRWLSGFRWSEQNVRIGGVSLLLIAAAFTGFYALPSKAAIGLGTVLLVSSCVYSLHLVAKLMDGHEVPPALRRILKFVRPSSQPAFKGHENPSRGLRPAEIVQEPIP